jgi:hypothetical protein
MIPSYTKILHLGHKRNQNLYSAQHVWVEEKIDGSQFAFSKCAETGQLLFRSKRSEIHDGDAGIFAAAVAAVKAREHLLTPGWVYRGEAMRGPKHNVLAYDSAPEGNVVIWDIEISPTVFMHPVLRQGEARRLGFTPVNMLRSNVDAPLTADDCEELLQTQSQLGGVPIEGFVVKQHEAFNHEGKLMLYKFVSERFKEKHKRAANPGGYAKKQQVLEMLKARYARPARWAKARQRLIEEGKADHSPKDIGALINYAKQDIAEEEREEIKEALYQAFAKEILAGAVRGLPEWYKLELATVATHHYTPAQGACP